MTPVTADVSHTKSFANRVESRTSNQENSAPRFIDLRPLARGSPVMIRRRYRVLELLKLSTSSPSSTSSDSSDSGTSDREWPKDRLSDIDRRTAIPTSGKVDCDAGLDRTSSEVAQNIVRRTKDDTLVDPAPFGHDLVCELFAVPYERLRDVDPYPKRITWFPSLNFLVFSKCPLNVAQL